MVCERKVVLYCLGFFLRNNSKIMAINSCVLVGKGHQGGRFNGNSALRRVLTS